LQAYSIAFLVGMCDADGTKAAAYLRLATECLNSVSTLGLAAEAVDLSTWGIQTLNT